MKIADTSAQDVILTPTNSNKKWITTSIVLVAIVVAFVVALPMLSRWSSADASISSERVRLATVSHGDLVRDLAVQGKVVAAVSPRLYAPAQGIITFTVKAGDAVNKDQQLAVIDSPELTNRLEQEEATLAQLQIESERQRIQSKKQQIENQKAVDLAQVTLTAAEREFRRAETAYSANTISQIDYEKARDDLANARLVYRHAEQDASLNLESLAFEEKTRQLLVERQTLLVGEYRRQVDELTLRSPVDGIVGNLTVENKNQIAQYQAVLSVVDLTEFELELQIPESYADDLAIGMLAEVQYNGQPVAARLVTISPEVQQSQVTGRIRFEPGLSPQGLRQNQRLTTRILLENKADVTLVQRGQFLESSSGRFAYKVVDGLAVKTPIEVGSRSLTNVEIVAGLNVGDTIIISSTDAFAGADQVLLTQ